MGCFQFHTIQYKKSNVAIPQVRQKQITQFDMKQFEEIRKARGVWLSMPITEKQAYISKIDNVGIDQETGAYKIFLNEYLVKSETPQKMVQRPTIYQGMRI